MRLFFTLLTFLFIVAANAANGRNDSIPVKAYPAISVSSVKKDNVSVSLSCQATNFANNPLLVIDGVRVELSELQKLDPDDIASINILKWTEDRLFSCRSPRGSIIIITTKAASTRKFIIKDITDSSVIAGASVFFIAKDNVVRGAADGSGILITDKLKPGVQYEMIISSVGYKSFRTSFTNTYSTEQQIFLERDMEMGNEIIVRCMYRRSRGCPRSVYINQPTVSKTAEEKKVERIPVKSIYPNPVQRSSVFNLEFNNEHEEILQLSVVGLDGRIVLLQPQKAIAGLNRFNVNADARWAAGVYIVWLKNEKGSIIKQGKLVVQ